MKRLFWSHDPVMASVHATEDGILQLRKTVGRALERAVVPAQEYLDTLQPFVEFLNLDGAFGRQFVRTDSVADVGHDMPMLTATQTALTLSIVFASSTAVCLTSRTSAGIKEAFSLSIRLKDKLY